MLEQFKDTIEEQIEGAVFAQIDNWFRTNGTRHYYQYLAGVTLDIGTEENGIELN